MCYISVQCNCKHNIAVPKPDCIRPRHPRGCWIVRRGEPSKDDCPACQEYHNPANEQCTWDEVIRFHQDATYDLSEAAHRNVVAADKSRHEGCEGERLDLRKRLRWKAMAKAGLIRGYRVTDDGIIVQVMEEYEAEGMEEGFGFVDRQAEELKELEPREDVQKVILEDEDEDDKENSELGETEGYIPIGHEVILGSGSVKSMEVVISAELQDPGYAYENADDEHFEIGSTSTFSDDEGSDSDEWEPGMGRLTIAYIPEEDEDISDSSSSGASDKTVNGDSPRGSPRGSPPPVPSRSTKPVLVRAPPFPYPRGTGNESLHQTEEIQSSPSGRHHSHINSHMPLSPLESLGCDKLENGQKTDQGSKEEKVNDTT
ncbi:hypothetical protein ABW19_dt0200993 [Dactylella cylindrospora]|nr:hypothetical protein ABW19_dt0200993 [Dactylella cylindrospora]